MGAPLLIPAIGAAAGALMKPNNPLQGALLGAAAGYTGGQALGITGATTAAAAPIASTVPAANTALATQIAANPAASYAGGNILNAANAANTANTANLASMNAAGMSFGGRSPVDSAMLNTTSATPSLLDKAGMYAKSAYENPVATGQTFGYANSLLQPDQQMASAPVVPIQTGRGVKEFNPMASMDPYRPSVIGSNQPISLLG
jgi:hypothetical protein